MKPCMEIPVIITASFFTTYYIIHKTIAAWQVWHESYRIHYKNAWMRNECANPTFYANMQIHSDVCEKVQKQAITTPFMHAAQTFLKIDDLQILCLGLLVTFFLGRWIISCWVCKRQFILLPK